MTKGDNRLVVLTTGPGNLEQFSLSGHLISRTRLGPVGYSLAVERGDKIVYAGGKYLYRVALSPHPKVKEFKTVQAVSDILLPTGTGQVGLVLCRGSEIALIGLRSAVVRTALALPVHLGAPLAGIILPGDRTAFVSTSNGFVVAVALRTGRLAHTVAVGKLPAALSLVPNGRLLLVGNYGSGSVSVIATKTLTTVRTIIAGPEPEEVVPVAAGRKLLIPDRSLGEVRVVKTSSGETLRRIDVGPMPESVVAVSRAVYVVTEPGVISVLSTYDYRVRAKIHVGKPIYPSMVIATSARIGYVMPFGNAIRSVMRLDLRSQRTYGLVHVGSRPSALAIVHW